LNKILVSKIFKFKNKLQTSLKLKRRESILFPGLIQVISSESTDSN